jgi:hypothetical protein
MYSSPETGPTTPSTTSVDRGPLHGEHGDVAVPVGDGDAGRRRLPQDARHGGGVGGVGDGSTSSGPTR